MEKKRKKQMEKEFDLAMGECLLCHDEGNRERAFYWVGFLCGMKRAAAIENEYNLEQINKRIKSVKKLVKEGEIAKSETEPTTDVAKNIESNLEKHKTLLATLKGVKKKIIADIEEGF